MLSISTKKFHIASIITALVLALGLGFNNSSQAKKRKNKLPTPKISSYLQAKISDQDSLVILGSNFVDNFPNIHKVVLKNSKSKYKPRVIQASPEQLEIKLPEGIDYGDYNLSLKLRSKFLKSRKTQASNPVLIRPVAPQAAELAYQVIQDPLETNMIIKNPDPNLVYQFSEPLKLGLNTVQAHYTQNGFKSLDSKTSEFYFLPASKVKSTIVIESEDPIKAFVQSQDGKQKINVSKLVQTESKPLSRHFFLNTPNNSRYLEYIEKLKAIYISELQATEPESATISNRGEQDFDLTDCHLKDLVKIRYEFEPTSILKAQNSLTIESNLGLNNTGDTLSLICNGEIIDSFSY